MHDIKIFWLTKNILIFFFFFFSLFTEDEFAVYRTLSYWLFLFLNPGCYSVPSISAIVAYFNWYSEKKIFSSVILFLTFLLPFINVSFYLIFLHFYLSTYFSIYFSLTLCLFINLSLSLPLSFIHLPTLIYFFLP